MQAWRATLARKSRALLLLTETEATDASCSSRPPNIVQASMKKEGREKRKSRADSALKGRMVLKKGRKKCTVGDTHSCQYPFCGSLKTASMSSLNTAAVLHFEFLFFIER